MGKIIDVSQWQGVINWDAVKPQIDAAIIRMGFGSDIASQDDRFWKRNVSECERLNIPYGVYLYSYATTPANVQGEIQHTLRLLKDCGRNFKLPVYFDAEDNVIRRYCRNAFPVWDAAIKRAGYRTGLYAGYYFRRNYMPDVRPDTWWLAWYNGTNGQVKPNTGGWKYDLWQYTDALHINGINSRVDASICYNNGIFAGNSKPSAATTASATRPTNTRPDVIVPRADVEIQCMNRGRSGKKVGGGQVCMYDDAVTGLSIGSTGGGIEYRVHRLNGGWFSRITKCDWKTPDAYAGDLRSPIDGVQIYFHTDNGQTGGKAYRVKYSVKTQRHGWLPPVYDTNWESGCGNHTAGIFGDPIIGINVTIVPA